MEQNWKPDKSRFKDANGRYLTQGLFLEVNYKPELSYYTLDGEHKTHNGVYYPSLKKLYIEMGDVVEYNFANTYLYDWGHWKRLQENAIIGRHIDTWREELELSLRAEGVQTIIDAAMNDKSYQAGKWLADKGWVEKTRGRPSKEEVKREKEKLAQIEKSFEEDFKLLEMKSNG